MEERDFIKVVSHSKKDGLKMAVSGDGELWINNDGQEWQALQFNKLYYNYYPACIFTEILYCCKGFIAAGMDAQGKPVVFQSLLGSVWNRIALSTFSPLRGTICVTGKILKVLCDEQSGQLYLLCVNGELAVLPECPKCLKVHKISNQPLIDGIVKSECIELMLQDGSKEVLSKDSVEQFRVSQSYAMQCMSLKHHFVDLRGKEGIKADFGECVSLLLEDVAEWLKGVEKNAYIFFFCNWGVQADEAALYARRHGWKKAFSLGGVKEGFHVK